VIRALLRHGASSDVVRKEPRLTPFEWCCTAGPLVAENALTLVRHVEYIKPSALTDLFSWIEVEVERLELFEENNADLLEEQAGENSDESPDADVLLELFYYACLVASRTGLPLKASVLPVKLARLVCQTAMYWDTVSCLHWLEAFVKLDCVRVESDVLTLGNERLDPKVAEFLETVQKKQLENIKSSFLPDASKEKPKSTAVKSKKKKKKK
jgi:hypothetical protein